MRPVNDSHSFKWLNATQFFGALNDNLFKLLMILFLIEILGKDQSDKVTGIAGIVFVIPFLLFSHAAGILADKWSKQRIIVLAKIAEAGIMLFGSVAFFTASPVVLYLVLFMMATQSAFFGPSKFGIIPELVPKESISQANSSLVSLTFLAIIIGTAAAPFLSAQIGSHYEIAGIICVCIAILGTITSLKIPQTPKNQSPKSFSLFFIKDIYHLIRRIYQTDKYLFLSLIGTAYFWFIAAFVQMNLISYGINMLGLSKEAGAFLFLIVAFGIGLGSYLAGKWSGRNIELGVVPIGAFGITVFCFLLGGTGNLVHIFVVYLMIALLGAGAGLFLIPIESFIQFRSPDKERGQILAVSNFLSFVGILGSSLLILFLGQISGFNPSHNFLVIASLTLFLTMITLWVLPDFLLRFIALVVMRFFYKLDIQGLKNVPVEGPALLVSNHVSWVDALLLIATQQRRIRFIMDRGIYKFPLLNPIFRLMGVIPISESDPPKQILKSLLEAKKILQEGYMVCIFAEGQITRSGQIAGFRKGFEKIVERTDIPVIPVYIGGAWGSIFSYYYQKPFVRLPSLIPYPVKILFGIPMSSKTQSVEIRQAVMELASETFEQEKSKRGSLSRMFIETARHCWFYKAIADSSGKSLSYGNTLTSVIVLARKLDAVLMKQEKVGILLPPSIGGVLANLSVTMLGKTPVNINYTASESSILYALKQCRIKTILTSRIVLKKLGNFPVTEGFVFLEDLLKTITLSDKIFGWLKARFVPAKWLDQNHFPCADKLATVIYSSGSTAEPKGVMLSHHNIISNIESLRMIFQLGQKDDLLGSLPFFHSFGYTVTLWFPLISGFSATYHANPLDTGKIVDLIRKNGSSIFLSTPTFLSAYMRKATPSDFSTLRYVITGAEKLKPRLSVAFKEKFGIQILEGYGATELSPIVSLNIPDVDIDGVKQIGTKEGTVGHPLPGITVKIIDPETNGNVQLDEQGMLLVKGPNVMQGYLENPEKTKEVLKDGWYQTGDIAAMDRDGFIRITDRISRFSKIGGEMVPHLAVEETYLKNLNATSQIVAVTSVPDDKKGEQLVVLYQEDAVNGEILYEIANQSELPNLWKPKKENYISITQMPVLGTGKLDLKGLRQIALEKLQGRQ